MFIDSNFTTGLTALRCWFCGLFIIFLSFNASSEDIEIYTGVFSAESAIGASPSDINPNVLFVLDNSGSMDSYRLIPVSSNDDGESGLYNATTDYGNDGNATDDDYIYVYDSDFNYTGEFIVPAQNQCLVYKNHLLNFPDNPVYLDEIIQWDKNGDKYSWSRDLVTSSDNNDIMECRYDRGRDGNNGDTTNTYPHDCSGQGCDSSVPRYMNNSPSGNSNPYRNARLKNLVIGNYHDFIQNFGAPVTVGDASDCDLDGQIVFNPVTGAKGECIRKFEIMKQALLNALPGFNDINVGLMDFNRNSPFFPSDGGNIIDAIADINDDDVRADFVSKVTNLQIDFWTPLAESLYEINRYFKGEEPFYGTSNTDPSALNDEGKYISPVVNECQDNNVVLLSDGLPTYDQHADELISDLIPGSCSFGSGQNGDGGSCLDDLAGYLRVTDMSPVDVRGVNPVYTYTIGFDADNPVLSAAADAGRPPGAELGSGYFRADDLVQLENVFRRIVGQIQSVDADTFVAPAVTVNAFNRLQNRDDIYYVVFKPDVTPRWNGNLKKYRVTSNAQIVDANGNNAISDATGFFVDEARSFWSETADGASVEGGGAAGRLSANRVLYGNVTNTNNVVKLTSDNSDTSVTEFIEQTVTDNNVNIGEITSGTDEEIALNRTNIARWTIGVDIDNDLGVGDDKPNFFIAESLHGTPYVLSYGTTEQNPQDMVFFTSNQGLLHAIVSQDQGESIPGGTEKWAYIPDPDLFQNLGGYYNRTSPDHIYGLDGEISFAVDRDPVTNRVTKAHLFFGQRRGGSKLFAVDVTNGYQTDSGAAPVSKLWTIQGGTGSYARMGQTWATPVSTKVNYCISGTCELTEVLVVSGGYDTAYDDETATLESLSGAVKGNAIYIINAANGDLLWMASNAVANSSRDTVNANMTHSFPSSPTVLDVNSDGAADIIFAIDIAGRVFRFDLKATSIDDSSIDSANNTGKVASGVIADLSESNVDRRFFNPLDTVLLPADNDSGVPTRYGLVTGSGYRAHPLDPESFGNRLYVLFDTNVLEPQYDEDLNPDIDGDTDSEAIYLYTTDDTDTPSIIDMDVSSTALSVVNADTPLDLSSTHRNGYFTELTSPGEKVLTPTLISDFRAIAVSYIPEPTDNTGGTGSQSGSCTAGVGNSNAHELDLNTGVVRTTQLSKPGLTAQPVVLYSLEVDEQTGKETLQPVVIIGTEPFAGSEFGLTDLELGKAEKKAWWENNRQN